jgi:hypothetical protein
LKIEELKSDFHRVCSAVKLFGGAMSRLDRPDLAWLPVRAEFQFASALLAVEFRLFWVWMGHRNLGCQSPRQAVGLGA